MSDSLRPHGVLGFTDSSAGKESACDAGDPGSIPRSGRSVGEGIGYPPQYSSWASLVAQLVKNLPAMRGDLGSILGLADPLEKGTGCPLQYPGLEKSINSVALGLAKSQTGLNNFHTFILDCSPPRSSVRGILQARILEWVAISSSKGSIPDPGIQPRSLRCPALTSRFFTAGASWETLPPFLTGSRKCFRTANPNVFGTRELLSWKTMFPWMDPAGRWVSDDSSPLHLSCTRFTLLLHQH